LVLHPASRDVAEMVGYRGWLSSGHDTMALHPDRVHPVDAPEKAVLSARVIGIVPQGVRFELELEAEGRWRGRFRCHWDQPARIGEQLWIAAPGAPVFGLGADPGGG